MAAIDDYLRQIANAVYGEEVRGSIIGAIRECYNDTEALQEEAEEAINAALSAVNHTMTALMSQIPIFDIDYIGEKITINTHGRYAYIYHMGRTYAIEPSFTQAPIAFPSAFFVLWYDTSSNTFGAGEFTDVTENRIPILLKWDSQIFTLANMSTPIGTNSFAGKTAYCYGDSLTWYDGNEYTWGPEQGTICIGFESYLRKYLGMTAINVGVSGETTPQICQRIRYDTAYRNSDYLFIMSGDNDDRLNVSLGVLIEGYGNTYDTNTVIGALQAAIEAAIDNSNKKMKIILMTEPMGWTYKNNNFNRVPDEIADAYRKVAKNYGLPLIDLRALSGFNEGTRSEYYLDPMPPTNQLYIYHPNNKGWERLSRIIVEKLQ